MKLKPTRIKVSAKEQEKSIRIEINALDKKDGRKVFSFNLYETDLDEVMKMLVITFETFWGHFKTIRQAVVDQPVTNPFDAILLAELDW